MFIDSPQNPKIKLYARLKTRKERERREMCLVEGVRLVQDLLDSDWPVECIFVEDAAEQEVARLRRHPRWPESAIQVSSHAFVALSDTVSSQGVVAVARIPKEMHTPTYPSTACLLDGVQDPGNVGTLLRSAEAFGVGEFCVGRGTVDVFAPKVARSSMGGLFRIHSTEADSATYLQEWRLRHPMGAVYVADADGQDVCTHITFAEPWLLVIGSEANGASARVKNLATHIVSIPMLGRAESLNAAMAGSILLYEAFRTRLAENGLGSSLTEM
ncbi:RNA methyltransferase [Alicyclobacillus sp. SP_1]|uniref:TrmH family RNA methyltransferase n=1 Tax=Alicyclobacillus sp. SP_1 TaxID=2942475 RepID=UPI002157F50F|nr:RNA methyltransferase [Alicyclobacillus sp. SP_1]